MNEQDKAEIAKVIPKLIKAHKGDLSAITRIVAGARLASLGYVQQGFVIDDRTLGQSGVEESYHVVLDGDPARYTCSCPDWQSGEAPYSNFVGGPMCRHAWADFILWSVWGHMPPDEVVQRVLKQLW